MALGLAVVQSRFENPREILEDQLRRGRCIGGWLITAMVAVATQDTVIQLRAAIRKLLIVLDNIPPAHNHPDRISRDARPAPRHALLLQQRPRTACRAPISEHE